MKIGVVINHVEELSTGQCPSYAFMRQMAQTAESGGLDSVWVFDHLLLRADDAPGVTRGIWEGWTLLSALAEATERVELGTLVLCNPFRNPALLAKMAHTLDEICDGRLILGIGAGWHRPEFEAFGFPFDRRFSRFEEALQILLPLLRGERVDFAGTFYEAEDCLITPLGPRPRGIPLLIGGRGPRMLRLVARHADQWNAVWLGEAQELAERLEPLRAACAEVGRDPATLDVTVGVQVVYPDLGATDSWTRKPLGGSAQELAQAFEAYGAARVAHLMVNVSPFSLPALERLTAAVRVYRDGSG